MFDVSFELRKKPRIVFKEREKKTQNINKIKKKKFTSWNYNNNIICVVL